MAGKLNPERVPKGWEDYFATFSEVTDDFCRRHLTEEYAPLTRRAIAALCRKRPSPLHSGLIRTWACGIIYALAQFNFGQEVGGARPMDLGEICDLFGVTRPTGSAKAKAVRKALNMERNPDPWTLPSILEANPPVTAEWLASLGITVMNKRGKVILSPARIDASMVDDDDTER